MSWEPSTEIIVLIVIWVVGHLSLFGAVDDNLKKYSLFVVMVLMVTAYSIKPGTMDLWSYSVYFDTGKVSGGGLPLPESGGYRLEDLAPEERLGDPYNRRYPDSPLFAWTIQLLAKALPHGMFLPRLQILSRGYVSDSLVFSVIGIGLILLVIATWNFLHDQLGSKDRRSFLLICTPIILGSVFFFVGSQNAIRQFLSLSVCILACSFLGRQRLLLAVFAATATIFIHQAGWAFVALGLVLLMLQNIAPVRINEIRPLTLLASDWIGLAIGLLILLTLVFLINNEIYKFAYYSSLMDWRDNFRSSTTVKASALCVSIIVSECVAGKTRTTGAINIRQLRRAAFFIVMPLLFFPEIFSRIYFFYLGFEAIYIVWALTRDARRVRLSGALIFGIYAIAPNALNVLVGKGWYGVIGI
jgi:hypothetical protein